MSLLKRWGLGGTSRRGDHAYLFLAQFYKCRDFLLVKRLEMSCSESNTVQPPEPTVGPTPPYILLASTWHNRWSQALPIFATCSSAAVYYCQCKSKSMLAWEWSWGSNTKPRWNTLSQSLTEYLFVIRILSNTYISVFVHYAVLVHGGNVVMFEGRILQRRVH